MLCHQRLCRFFSLAQDMLRHSVNSAWADAAGADKAYFIKSHPFQKLLITGEYIGKQRFIRMPLHQYKDQLFGEKRLGFGLVR